MTEPRKEVTSPVGDVIDSLARRFEVEFRSGSDPLIEDFLQHASVHRKRVLAELIRLELHLRHEHQNDPPWDEYRRRFPDDLEIIDLMINTCEKTSKGSTIASDEADDAITQASNSVFNNDASQEIQIEQIGRYLVQRKLGVGGFGIVYLADDPKLERPVAIKMARPNRSQAASEMGTILSEARAAAKLKHPGLVSVFDVVEEHGQPYIVQDYIDGEHLGIWARNQRPSFKQIAEVFISIAEAIDYAHKHGLTHCDLKLTNILMDRANQPHVADFGLAIQEGEQAFYQGKRFGTPDSMSPEQVRGEGHRLDGRTDIWALGVILYQLLVDRRPFEANEHATVFEQILTHDPKPPRQIDHRVPRELDRVCLKCLSRRRLDRYPSAQNLADDLRAWVQSNSSSLDESSVATSWATSSHHVTDSLPPPKVLPKGLRSFDEHDADFFLSLLPGPHDRSGVPESIRFWKQRIEDTDYDDPVSVGLIYGPSGCGKSSLVKAGLIPLLGDGVTSVYIEASADDTELRLERAIAKRFPDETGASLRETISRLRTSARKNEKLLIVLDQFEQWLHAHRGHEATELTDALRQCDGEHVQAILIVRDDFWMMASQFMRELEIPIAEGVNSAAVDLFSRRHARWVMTQYGRALGTLPENQDLSADQAKFLDRSIEELSQDGKVNCVRLALFTEMMSQVPWSTQELDRVGGLEGVGIAYLEETFSRATSSPRFRVHQEAARAVLEALLPEAGDEIRGGMRSYSSLVEASGYSDARKFDDLLTALDSETRLITPCDSDDSGGENGEKHYQLTHDYLVPSIRGWLSKERRQTREGRALLQLADRASFWNAHRETKQLPTWMEWISILLWTRSDHWTSTQKEMMKAGNRLYGIRMLLMLFLLASTLVFGFGVRAHMQREQERYERESVVRLIEGTNTTEAIQLIRDKMPSADREVQRLLRDRLSQLPTDSKSAMHLRLALLPSDQDQLDVLKDDLLRIPLSDLLFVRDALADYGRELSDPMWEVAANPSENPSRRIDASALLAAYDPPAPGDERWKSLAPLLVSDILELVMQNPSQFTMLRDAFDNVAMLLYDDLRPNFEARDMPEQRFWATAFLSAWTLSDLEYRSDLILAADERQFQELIGAFDQVRDPLLDVFRQELAMPADPPSDASARVQLASRQANAALALLRTGNGDAVWHLFARSPDENVRSYLIERINWAIGTDELVERIRVARDPGILSGLMLALGSSARSFAGSLTPAQTARLSETLSARFAEDTDLGVHSAAEWALGQWRISPPGELPERDETDDWFVDKFGIVMCVIRGPVEFRMGSPWEDSERSENEIYEMKSIPYDFAIGAKELTVAQYRDFQDRYPDIATPRFSGFNSEFVRPQSAITWHQAALFCNELSKTAGFPPEQYCYEPSHMDKGIQIMRAVPDAIRRYGYRLPTEVEWEFACRAGTITSRYHGDSLELLEGYAFRNVEGKINEGGTNDVGSLMPNNFGLYDMLGNVREWCHDNMNGDSEGILRGGSMYFHNETIRSANRAVLDPNVSLFDIGIRVARTLPESDQP